MRASCSSNVGGGGGGGGGGRSSSWPGEVVYDPSRALGPLSRNKSSFIEVNPGFRILLIVLFRNLNRNSVFFKKIPQF